MDFDLSGKVSLVTGASRGVGRAIALKLAEVGAETALLARSTEALKELAEQIQSAGGRAECFPCDASEADAIEAAVADVRRKMGRIDILVNNAAIFSNKPIVDLPLSEWEHVMRVNLTSVFVFCRAVWPAMIAAGSGVIVNIGSNAGKQGYAHQSVYCASKHGLAGFAKVLALEGAEHHIRVHTLCPGGVRTGFAEGTGLADRLEGQVLIEPENLADLCLFLIAQPPNVDIQEVVVRRGFRSG